MTRRGLKPRVPRGAKDCNDNRCTRTDSKPKPGDYQETS